MTSVLSLTRENNPNICYMFNFVMSCVCTFIVLYCQAFLFVYLVLIVLSSVSICKVLYSIAISCAHILTLYYGAHVSGILLIKLIWRGSVTDVSASVIC